MRLLYVSKHSTELSTCGFTYSGSCIDPPTQWNLSGTVFQSLAIVTIAPASRTPYPNKWLNSRPTPFLRHWWTSSWSWFLLEVSTVRCCMSLHVRSGLQDSNTLGDSVSRKVISEHIFLNRTLYFHRESSHYFCASLNSSSTWNPLYEANMCNTYM